VKSNGPQKSSTPKCNAQIGNLTKRPHRRSIRTVQLYSPGGSNVHPIYNNASVDPLESIPQTTSRSVQLFSQSSRSWRADKQTDRQRDHGDPATLHCVSKNDTDVTHYNFSIHQAILVIFGRGVAERVCYRTVICYPTSPSPFPIYLAKLVGKDKFDPTQLRNRLTDFDKIRTSELSPGDQPPLKISFRSDDAEQGMGHSEWPMTQVTHWALDPCDPWPMGHGSHGSRQTKQTNKQKKTNEMLLLNFLLVLFLTLTFTVNFL